MAMYLYQSPELQDSPLSIRNICRATQRDVNLHLENYVGTPMGCHFLQVKDRSFISLGTVYIPKSGGTQEDPSDWLTVFLSIEGAKAVRDQLDDAIAKAENALATPQEVVVEPLVS